MQTSLFLIVIALFEIILPSSLQADDKLKIYLKPSNSSAAEKITSVPVEAPETTTPLPATEPATPSSPQTIQSQPMPEKQKMPPGRLPSPAAGAETAHPPSSPPSKEAHEVASVAPEKALSWLQNGNKRYTKGLLRKDGTTAKDRQSLVEGQRPHAIVLSCSDSRVPPELVFDQKLGEIFVVRTAGEVLDLNAIGSIEYALMHLGAKLIVVLGHESCGAVKASLLTLGGADAGSPALNALVRDIHPRLREFANKSPSTGLLSESWANVKGVAQDLVERSQIIHEKFSKGEIQIHTAVYHLGSGEAEFKPEMNPALAH